MKRIILVGFFAVALGLSPVLADDFGGLIADGDFGEGLTHYIVTGPGSVNVWNSPGWGFKDIPETTSNWVDMQNLSPIWQQVEHKEGALVSDELVEYTFSMDSAREQVWWWGTTTFTMYLAWYGDDGALIDTTSGQWQYSGATASGWQNLSITGTPPAGAVSVKPGAKMETVSGTYRIMMDNWQLTASVDVLALLNRVLALETASAVNASAIASNTEALAEVIADNTEALEEIADNTEAITTLDARINAIEAALSKPGASGISRYPRP